MEDMVLVKYDSSGMQQWNRTWKMDYGAEGFGAGIVNYFTDLSRAFSRQKEAKRVYKEVKKENLDSTNMTEYQK